MIGEQNQVSGGVEEMRQEGVEDQRREREREEVKVSRGLTAASTRNASGDIYRRSENAWQRSWSVPRQVEERDVV
jgi:hypothetical protein